MGVVERAQATNRFANILRNSLTKASLSLRQSGTCPSHDVPDPALSASNRRFPALSDTNRHFKCRIRQYPALQHVSHASVCQCDPALPANPAFSAILCAGSASFRRYPPGSGTDRQYPAFTSAGSTSSAFNGAFVRRFANNSGGPVCCWRPIAAPSLL